MADRNTPKPEPNTRLQRPDPSNPEDFLVLLLRAVKSFEKEIQEVQKGIKDAQKAGAKRQKRLSKAGAKLQNRRLL